VKAVLFDTETTDLITTTARALDKQPRIIEFYACLIDPAKPKVLGEIEFLCDPGQPLREETTKITGITQADLKGKAPFKEHLPKVQALFSKADVVVAHNLSYDFSMVNFETERAGKLFKWPARKLCTVEMTEHLKGYRLSLTNLHELLFDKPFDGAHRAKQDVEALVRCYRELLTRGEI